MKWSALVSDFLGFLFYGRFDYAAGFNTVGAYIGVQFFPVAHYVYLLEIRFEFSFAGFVRMAHRIS